MSGSAQTLRHQWSAVSMELRQRNMCSAQKRRKRKRRSHSKTVRWNEEWKELVHCSALAVKRKWLELIVNGEKTIELAATRLAKLDQCQELVRSGCGRWRCSSALNGSQMRGSKSCVTCTASTGRLVVVHQRNRTFCCTRSSAVEAGLCALASSLCKDARKHHRRTS